MNWLAHVFLSPKTIEAQLGNILADVLKGKAWEGASDEILEGMRLHTLIDTFTDTHPLVQESKALLGEKAPLKGVALDLFYDHMLSIHWGRFSTKDRKRFLAHFRTRAIKASGGYPPKAKRIITTLVTQKQLESYESFEGLKASFIRIENRLSERAKRKDTMMAYLSLIRENHSKLEAMFLMFFPELMALVQEHSKIKSFDHFNTKKANAQRL